MENDDPMETEDSLTNNPDNPSTEHQNKQDEDPFQFLQFPQHSPKKIAQNPKQSPNINQIPNIEIPIKERLIYEQKFNQIENEMIKTRTELKIQQENHQKSLLKLQEKEKEILDLKSQLGQRAVSPVREDSVKYTILLQKKQEEIVKLSSENADLVQREKETRTILAQVRQQNNDLQQVDLQQKQKIVNLTHENDRFIKQNEWFQSELNQKSLEFDTYRKEKNVQISKLQNDLENEAQENNSLTTRNDLLQKRLNELEEKYTEKIEKIRKIENDKIMTEQQFKNEMISQKKLADLYFQKQKETSNKNQELEDLIKELEIKLMDLDSAKEHEKVEYESEVQSLKDQLSQQGLEIEKLSSELEIINNELNKQNTYSQIGLLSETAAVAGRILKQNDSQENSRLGKTVTQMYSDYSKIQKELIKEKSEVARLTDCINHIVAEFEQRAPLIQKTNQEYQKARDQIEVLSNDLVKAAREKNIAKEETKKAKEELEKLILENRLLEKDVKDRSRQVQGLLREQYMKENNAKEMEIELEDDDESGADAIITKRLVVFKNIQELQNQNEALLRSIRSLSAKMEAQELKEQTEMEQKSTAALNESAALIEDLQEQLKRELLNSESYCRERDTWRRIAESKSLTDPSERIVQETTSLNDMASYKELQREFDIYRKECGTDTKLLKDQLDLVQHEKTELTIQVAKLNNQIGYLNERHELNVKSYETKAKEFEALLARIKSMNEMSARQDAKIEEISISLTNARHELTTLNGENQQLKLQAQLSKNSEDRAIKEAQDYLKERNYANDRIRDLQEHIREHDQKSCAQIAKMQELTDQLSQELQLARKQLANLMDDNRTVTAKRDSELREYQIKIEKLTTDYERTKGELALALNKESNATSRVKELSAKISTLEHRTIHFESMSTSNEGKESGGSTVELSSMKIELNAAKSELKLAQQQVETFKEISQASEDRLAEMNSTFDIYKTETDKLTMDLQAKVQNLEADRLGLVEKLAQVSRTLTETQEKMDAQVEAFNASNNIYETQIRSLKANEERALKSVAGIKSDLDRQCKSIQEVQENYEREVMAHSTSLNTLNELKQKNMRLIAEKDKLAVEKGSIETELNNSKESFEVIESKLENQIKELEKRLADLNTQNQLLHATFEQLSASKHLVPDENGDPGVESKTITDLREVIQFLRREKEIADTKLQLATQEGQRNLIQIQQLQKSLEESRICVEEERKRNSDLSGTERQHRELLEKIEQANLLRESNITLRSHLESAHNQVSQLETKLKSTESSIEPLKTKVNDLESELAVRAAECQTLMEDNTRWKGRAQQILEKYERIDPVEHERLRNDVSRLSAEAKEYSERLRKAQDEFEQKIAEKEILIKNIEKTIEQVREESRNALQDKENQIKTLNDPNANPILIDMNKQLEALNKRFVELKNNANEKLKASYKERSEIKKQLVQLQEEKLSIEKELKALLESKMEINAAPEITKPADETDNKMDLVPPGEESGGNVAEADAINKRERESEVIQEQSAMSPAAKRVRVENDAHKAIGASQLSKTLAIPENEFNSVNTIERVLSLEETAKASKVPFKETPLIQASVEKSMENIKKVEEVKVIVNAVEQTPAQVSAPVENNPVKSTGVQQSAPTKVPIQRQPIPAASPVLTTENTQTSSTKDTSPSEPTKILSLPNNSLPAPIESNTVSAIETTPNESIVLVPSVDSTLKKTDNPTIEIPNPNVPKVIESAPKKSAEAARLEKTLLLKAKLAAETSNRNIVKKPGSITPDGTSPKTAGQPVRGRGRGTPQITIRGRGRGRGATTPTATQR